MFIILAGIVIFIDYILLKADIVVHMVQSRDGVLINWKAWRRLNNNILFKAAVKCRLVLHHCVVIFFWSPGIMECTCMLFTFENGVPLMR